MKIIKLKKITRIIFVFISLISIIGIAFPAKAETLSDLLRRQAELDAKIKTNQNALNSAQKDINSIQGVIDSLDGQISITETDLNLSMQKIDLTIEQINQTQTEIDQKLKDLEVGKQKLYETIRTYYENSQTSTLEMVVGSNSLNDAIDRTQYLEAVSSQLNDQVAKINQAKADLENQKKQQQDEKSSLESQKSALLDKKNGLEQQKNQKNTLLGQSVDEKNDYQAQLANLLKEKSQVAASVAAAGRAGGTVRGGSSGYPYSAIDVPDSWGFLTRECVSYAAWYWNDKLGKPWYRGPGPVGTGNAKNWPNLIDYNNNRFGTHYAKHSSPAVGALVVWSFGAYGHVAIVEAVNSDGTVDISEFNYIRPGYLWSYRSHINPGGDGSYVYIY